MTTIHTNDHRNEDRNQSASYVDGKPQESASTIGVLSYYGKLRVSENITASYDVTVKDTRTVHVTFDTWGDLPGGVVPELLQDTSDQRLDMFYLDQVRFTWTRKFTGDNKDAQWKISGGRFDSGSKIHVSGDNYRKNGTRGQITGGTIYPRIVERREPTGQIKDESYFGMPYDELPDFKKKWWGQPVTDTFHDPQPLPQWLQTIVDRTHPVTGENPFTFGNEHVYGKFDETDIKED